ncbi:MAG: RseA family anti-sigma factor [Colwellia sp.]
MSEIKLESVSSLVDNYTPSTDENMSAHLIDNMLKDEELSATWQNYHLIGDVLRDEVPQSLQLDLSQTIADAIAQEATILSPNSSTLTHTSTNESVDDAVSATKENEIQTTNTVVDARQRFKAKIANLAKPMGQVAIAASAAALMIVGVQHNVADNDIIPNHVVQTVPLSGYANPVSFSVQSPQSDVSYQSKQYTQQAMNEQIAVERVAQQRRLQALLKDHKLQVKLGSNIK